jgi:hypothetical protein
MFKLGNPTNYLINPPKAGGKIMTTLPIDIEIDRLLNLIRGFGWEMEKKEISDEEVTLTITKKIS